MGLNEGAEKRQDETSFRRYAMSWEDVYARFPYGLPASLRRGGWRWFLSPNIIDLDEERRRRQQQERPA
jgi:hypothetical protein